MKILYLGNSITKHPPLEDKGWFGNYGMAASCRKNDYVHVLNKMIKKNDKNFSFKAVNIAKFEREPLDIDKLEKNSTIKSFIRYNPDVIVYRLIENVPQNDVYYDRFKKFSIGLINLLNKNNDKKVFVSGAFWVREKGDVLLEDVANITNSTFVSFKELHKNEYKAIDKFESLDIGSHPGDLGMEKIALTIFESMEKEGILK